MKRLFLFNNECEMAIGNQLPHYSPPRNIAQMRNELACIMTFFTAKGDYVLCHEYPQREYVDLIHKLGLNVNYITVQDITTSKDNFEYVPWGNAPNINRTMQQMHINPHYQEWTDDMRNKVSRCTMAQCIEEWNTLFPNQIIEDVCVAKSIEEVDKEIGKKGNCVIKAPWSSSGKGILFVAQKLQEKEKEWIHGILKKQGSVTIERRYDKINDFGLEFYITENGDVEFLGTSLFYTGTNGEYIGNHIMSEEAIRHHVGVTTQLITQVTSILKTQVATWYRGYLGVDMLQTTDRIIPFIEINYRLNMGILALKLHEQICAPHRKGIFSIKQYAPKEAQQYYTQQLHNCCFNVEGKLEKGILALTPVTDETRFVAQIEMD
ncbi:MAG: hypothetical protein ACRDDZ_01985 [Marinifilaceae bacterium]